MNRLPLTLIALVTTFVTGCAARQICPTIDYDALATHVVDDVFRRLDPERADEAREPYEGEPDEQDEGGDPFAELIFENVPCRGNVAAEVRVLVFSDFECPFCSRYASTIDRAVEEHGDEILVCFLNYPLPFHPHAQLAAEAALEAYEQGGADAFFRMHDRLFANQRALELDDLLRYARELGLDVEEMRAALSDHRHADLVDEDVAFGEELGVQGTPSTFVESEEVGGAVPYDQLDEAIERALARRR